MRIPHERNMTFHRIGKYLSGHGKSSIKAICDALEPPDLGIRHKMERTIINMIEQGWLTSWSDGQLTLCGKLREYYEGCVPIQRAKVAVVPSREVISRGEFKPMTFYAGVSDKIKLRPSITIGGTIASADMDAAVEAFIKDAE